MQVSCISAALGLSLLAGVGNGAGAQTADPTVSVKQDDVLMEAAKQKGRATLAEFFALARNPQPAMSNFALKVGVGRKDSLEFVWVRPFEKKGDRYSGQLRNDVMSDPRLKYGDIITFGEGDIIDWYYLNAGAMNGNFTGCVALQRLPKAEAIAIRNQNRMNCEIK